MANICIPKEQVKAVRKIMESTKNNSAARQEKLAQIFGQEGAQDINLLYEKTLLLKNQDKAFTKFLNSINGIGEKEKQVLKEKIAERIAERNTKINQEELLAIVKDITDRKYDIDIRPEQAQKIAQLQVEIDDLAKKMEGTPEGSLAREKYGLKVGEQADYINSLINPEDSLGFFKTLEEQAKQTARQFDSNAPFMQNLSTGIGTAVDLTTSPLLKSILASMDFSFAFKQGLKTLATNPTMWRDNIIKAFEPFKKITSQKAQAEAYNLWRARIISDPMYKKMIDSKLGIGVIEEFFPTALAEKIPVLGNIFRASNLAFTIFSQGVRADLFKQMIAHADDLALKGGAPVTKEVERELAMLANSLSGRGDVGSAAAISDGLNRLFFSGRYIKSALDTFYLPFKPGLSPVARKLATEASVKTLGMIGTLMATAHLMGAEVGLDPLSSKFGKVKIPGKGDTWIDLTGGLGAYITLAFRQAMGQTRSAKTGKLTELNSGKFGSMTRFDVLVNAFTNKLAPIPSTIVQITKGRDFTGEKPTVGSVSKNLLMPISANNMLKTFQNNDSATAFLASVADILGASQTDYSSFQK